MQLQHQEVPVEVGFELSSSSESGDIPISVDGELVVEVENLNISPSVSDVTATRRNSQMTNEKYYSSDERRKKPDDVLINVLNTRIATRSRQLVTLWDAMTGAEIWSSLDGVNGGMCFSECGDFLAYYQSDFLGTTAVVIDTLSPGEMKFITKRRQPVPWYKNISNALTRSGDTVRLAFVEDSYSTRSTPKLRQPRTGLAISTGLFQLTVLDIVEAPSPREPGMQTLFYLEKGKYLYFIQYAFREVTITCWAVVSDQLLRRHSIMSLSLPLQFTTLFQSHEYLGIVEGAAGRDVTSIIHLPSFTGQSAKKNDLEHPGVWFPVRDGFLNIQPGRVLLLERGRSVHRQLGFIRCDSSKLSLVTAVAVGEGGRTWMTLVFKDGMFDFYKRNDLNIWELVSAQ